MPERKDDPVYLNGRPWTPKEWVGFGGIIAAVLGLTITVAACTTKSDAAKAAAQVAAQQATVAPDLAVDTAPTSAPASNEPTPSDTQAMDAMVQGHPHATKICIDTERDGYYIHWPEAADSEKVFVGWHFIEKKNIQFYFMKQNNTFFIGDPGADKYPQVYPDVTGLPCKDM